MKQYMLVILCSAAVGASLSILLTILGVKSIFIGGIVGGIIGGFSGAYLVSK